MRLELHLRFGLLDGLLWLLWLLWSHGLIQKSFQKEERSHKQ